MSYCDGKTRNISLTPVKFLSKSLLRDILVRGEADSEKDHQREVSVLLSSLAHPTTVMSCEILPDAPHVPSSSSSSQHSIPAHLALALPQRNDPEIKTEAFGDSWDGDRDVEYQCDISCYGVTAAGAGVTEPRAMEEEEDGDRGMWWAESKSTSHFNAMRDECPSRAHENRVGGDDAHENEARRGEGEREPAFSLWPLPPLSHEAAREEGFLDGVTVSRRAFCDARSQDCGLSDVTSHEPSIDAFSPEHNSPDMSTYRLFNRHSGIQLPVMTIEIEKWLMGLIVNDEADEKRKKRGKNAKKKSKQGGLLRQGGMKVARDTSGTQGPARDSIHSEVRFMCTRLALTFQTATKKDTVNTPCSRPHHTRQQTPGHSHEKVNFLILGKRRPVYLPLSLLHLPGVTGRCIPSGVMMSAVPDALIQMDLQLRNSNTNHVLIRN